MSIEGEVLSGGIRQSILGVTTETRAHPDQFNPILKPLLDNDVTLASLLSRTATLVVAASNSSAKSKAGADYVCTGADDQNTINDVINALPPDGGKVLLMEGTYTVSGSINLRSDMTLEGVGASTVIKLRDNHGTSITLIYGYAVTRSVVKNLVVDGNKAAGNATGGNYYGIRLYYGCTYCIVDSVTVCNTNHVGIYLDGESSGNNQTRYCLVTNCICYRSSPGISLRWSTRNTITSNNCSENGIAGIRASGDNNVITGNTCNWNTGHGILVDASGTLVTGNSCNRNTTGIRWTSQRGTMSGNTCNENLSWGIQLDSANDNVISANTVQNNNGGIELSSDSDRNTITGNHMSSNNNGGLVIVGGSYNNVQANTFKTGSFQNYGINVSSNTCAGNLITNNDLYDSGTTAFADNGTGTITTPGNRT